MLNLSTHPHHQLDHRNRRATQTLINSNFSTASPTSDISTTLAIMPRDASPGLNASPIRPETPENGDGEFPFEDQWGSSPETPPTTQYPDTDPDSPGDGAAVIGFLGTDLCIHNLHKLCGCKKTTDLVGLPCEECGYGNCTVTNLLDKGTVQQIQGVLDYEKRLGRPSEKFQAEIRSALRRAEKREATSATEDQDAHLTQHSRRDSDSQE